MSRISRGYLPAGRNAPAGAAASPSALLRREKSLAGVPTVDSEEFLDLFSSTRRGHLIPSSGESDVLNRKGKKASTGLAKVGGGTADEFLAVEVGKHDYDWLLTPPGTPLFSSVDSTGHLPPSTSQRSSSNLRPASHVKTSRLSVPQCENNGHGPRMARSSSTTRASSASSRTPSILNTSTASVNSRPTTPSARTRTPAATAPRPTASRSTTPARTRPSPVEKPKPVTMQTSRPITPTSRAHFPPHSMVISGLNPAETRQNSRSSTPTRRPPPPVANSRPISPAPRSRVPAQPAIPPDFPINAPSNLRTKLPERTISTGRQRPGMALTVRGNSNVEAAGSGVSSSRRAVSPAGALGRVADNQTKGRVNVNRYNPKLVENQKPTLLEKKPVKPAPEGEIGGYGRTMSKNSLSMALKHMDIRQGSCGMRGASLFPHSIRSAAAATLKERPATRSESAATPHNIPGYDGYNNEDRPINCSGSSSEEMIRCCEVETATKAYGSSRYDSSLLKEDRRSLNWFHGLDGRRPAGQTLPFDDRSRFEPFPEPFILL